MALGVALAKRQELCSIPLLVLCSVSIFDRSFRLLELRKRDPNLKGALGIQVKEMILPSHGLVGNAFIIQQLAEFSVNAWVVASPKGAKRIIGIFCVQAVFARGTQTACCRRRLTHQLRIAIGAARESWPILGFALRAEHGETGVYYTKKYFHTCQHCAAEQCALPLYFLLFAKSFETGRKLLYLNTLFVTCQNMYLLILF